MEVSTFLCDKDRALYETIVAGLLRICGSNDDKQESKCGIIFLQTKSWRHVEGMFEKIIRKATDLKIKAWAESWCTRIESMRAIQKGRVKNLKKHLKTHLLAGRLDLEHLDPIISQDAQCMDLCSTTFKIIG